MKIAFQGERGAFSEEASRTLLGKEIDVLPCPMFRKVFEAVASGAADTGVVPVENSQTGSITDNFDLLQEFSLHVMGEVFIRIRHCLQALPGQSLSSIRKVLSHPQALMQCDEFLRKHGMETVAEYDTAGSAKMVAEKKWVGTAAIASRVAAEIYGLEILQAGIETNPHNYTRFLQVSRTAGPRPSRAKTSIVFGAVHTPGSLHRALGCFATRQLNVTKLESRPRRQALWEYVFYLDFEGNPEDAGPREALEELKAHSSSLRILGTYSSWVPPAEAEP